MYGLLGICLALSVLLASNALASLVVAWLWRAIARPARVLPAAVRAELSFALRILPAAVSLACVIFFLTPAYILYEPAAAEAVSIKLAAFALVSAGGIALAAWRGFASWRATRRLVCDWMRHAEAIQIEGVRIPAYRVRHTFPVIAVVGVIRPRLFIAGHVFDALSADEVAAAMEHENGHLIAHDNLKRGLLRACRDMLTILPCGRSLHQAWAESSEAAADEYAARKGASVALDLASALVGIARIAPAGAGPTMPAGAFLSGETTGGLERRVRRLAQLATLDRAHNGRNSFLFSRIIYVCLSGFIAALAFTAMSPHVTATVHAAVEGMVWSLR